MSDASSTSLTSSSSSVSSPSTSTALTTLDQSSSSSTHAHSTATAAIAGTVGALCVLATLCALALLFWRRRKRRVLRSQQIAIRRMTIVGPSSAPSSLPYPFSAHGRSPGSFETRSNSGFGDIEMSTAKGFGTSGDEEAGLPWTNLPAPTYQRRRDRVDREREREPAPSTAADGASVFSSKQSDIGDGDRMVLVDGVYVLALEREDDTKNVEKEVKPARPRN